MSQPRKLRPVEVVSAEALQLLEPLVESGYAGARLAVHYARVACEMNVIAEIAGRHGLRIVEDNAHGLGAQFDALNGVVLHRPARRREPSAKPERPAPGALQGKRCSSGCAVPPLGIGIQAV